MKKTIKSIVTLCCLLVINTSALAGIIYENAYTGGGGNYHFSFNGDSTIGAENFTLIDDSIIQTISFTAHTNSQLPIDISWWIYSDIGNLPGSSLFSGTNANYTSSVIAPYQTGGIRDYSINVGSLNLLAGNYWIGFSPNGIDGRIHWSFSGTGDGLSALKQNGSWSSPYPGGNMAFRIEGMQGVDSIPEPPMLAILGLALAGLTLRRNKR